MTTRAAILIFLVSSISFAQQKPVDAKPTKPVEKVAPADADVNLDETPNVNTENGPQQPKQVKKIQPIPPKPKEDSKTLRGNSDFQVGLQISPIDLILPMKKGLSVTWVINESHSLEFEYVSAKTTPFFIKELGTMSDERFSLLHRYYGSSNSFNFFWGMSMMKFNLHLGDEFLNKLSAGYYPSADVIKMDSIGAVIGFGHRWHLHKNVILGVDWMGLSQPVSTLKKQSDFLNYVNDPDDRKKVEDAVSVLSAIPRVFLLKIAIGASF